MFVWKSTYEKLKADLAKQKKKFNALVIEASAIKQENKDLKAQLKKARKNDHRDSKGRFAKKPS